VLEIWAFDPGDSIWRLQPPHVPAGVLWQQDGFFYGPVSRVTFDEATGATVFMSSGGQVEADDGQTSWRAFPVDGEPVNPSGSRCDSLAPVYDPLNGRIVCLVGDGGVSSFSMAAGEWRWLLEPSGSDTAVGTIERPGGD
jgi:hypothetical protein